MMAVCRRLPATEPLDTQQPGAARRGPAREHPGGPFGNERDRRRPRKSGAGRVSPSREAAPAQAPARLWEPGDLRLTLSETVPTYSLKGSVPEAPAHVSVWLCTDEGGGGGAQPRVSTAGMRSSWGGRGRTNGAARAAAAMAKHLPILHPVHAACAVLMCGAAVRAPLGRAYAQTQR
jgi:hypothetical protein